MVTANWLGTLQSNSRISISSLARLLTWTLVVMLAWVIGRMVWLALQPTPSPATWQASTVAVSSSAGNDRGEITKVLNMNLFGRYQESAAPVVERKQPVKQDAPQTRLSLTLVGLVASSNPQTALAVITHRGKQNTYGLNEAIEGTRATLQAVYPDRVIIRNSGRDETLMLDGVDFNKPSQNTARTRPPEPRAPQEPEPTSDLSRIKQEILEKPQTLFSYIRLSQVKRDGELVGYRVNPGKERALFDAVGLKANDLAVSLNGNDLTDAAVMAKLWTELSSASDFTLTVEREGQLHDIYIELQ
ncbi:type II secretion system protein GspC [Photobacterium sp. ZSDE20]|uniref:Type II secretion system protein GspC n=1 Tax=Photobacterium pectinilyticum TaxID=2906793 RepID=A0ABT1N076_9GAMM|nr:type II secretion system protein GspC [Photobacterium sp. ZSDE20]MCQ1057932.1 type II secretion system protein GspC [Photobacterium sp. ZSDE20]MDD1822464.1 type II secretion system protein GspC [Photobacterium sp. ZSDE20]